MHESRDGAQPHRALGQCLVPLVSIQYRVRGGKSSRCFRNGLRTSRQPLFCAKLSDSLVRAPRTIFGHLPRHAGENDVQ